MRCTVAPSNRKDANAMEQAAGRQESSPVWIRGPRLRARWGNMSNTAFYEKLKKKLIPEWTRARIRACR